MIKKYHYHEKPSLTPHLPPPQLLPPTSPHIPLHHQLPPVHPLMTRLAQHHQIVPFILMEPVFNQAGGCVGGVLFVDVVGVEGDVAFGRGAVVAHGAFVEPEAGIVFGFGRGERIRWVRCGGCRRACGSNRHCRSGCRVTMGHVLPIHQCRKHRMPNDFIGDQYPVGPIGRQPRCKDPMEHQFPFLHIHFQMHIVQGTELLGVQQLTDTRMVLQTEQMGRKCKRGLS